MKSVPSRCKYAKTCFECPFPDVPPSCNHDFSAEDYRDGIQIFRSKRIEPFPRLAIGENVEVSAVFNRESNILYLSFFYDKFLYGYIDIGRRSPYNKANVLYSIGLEQSLGRKRAYQLVQGCYKYCFGVGNLMSHAIDRFYGDIIARKVKGEISKNEFYAICDRLKLKKGYTLV